VFAMTKDLFSFFILAALFGFGFAVYYSSLYSKSIPDSFGSYGVTLVTVVDNMLMNFDNPVSGE
jgi:hypothetical protein